MSRLVHVAVLLSVLAGCSRESAETKKSAVEAPRVTPAQIVQSLEMVDIPGGRFVMGVDVQTGFQNGYPKHEVTIRPFRIGKYEVTFEQYDAFAHATDRALPADEGWGRDKRPVIHVSWSDAQAFIAWLNTGGTRRFRLPSESEWEYAARGGTTTQYWWGDEADPNYANTDATVFPNAGKDTWQFTAPVGQFPANPFGLHDVLGNVWELVADCRHPNYEGAPIDGSAWLGDDCDSRIARGGMYASIRRGMQVAARAAAGETFDSMGLGFRVAEDAQGGQEQKIRSP